MLSREIGVSSNLVSYGKEKPARFLETVTLCEAFRGNFQRKLGSSLCYHTISVRTCFCVCIYLIFRFAYLAYCLCAILFSVSHSSIMNIFCCLYYMPGVYLKSPMLCLRCLLSFTLQNSLDSSVSDYRLNQIICLLYCCELSFFWSCF